MSKDTFILHSFRRCPFAIRTRIVLELKGVAYEVIEERLRDWTEELKERVDHPRVPILIHNDQIIEESNVINEYLDDLFPEPSLRPKDPVKLAQMRAWFAWNTFHFKPFIDVFKYGEGEKKEEARQKLYAGLAKIESALDMHTYLIGETFTLADVAIITFVRQISRIQPDTIDFTDYPKTTKWLNDLLEASYFKDRVMKKRPYHKEKEAAE